MARNSKAVGALTQAGGAMPRVGAKVIWTFKKVIPARGTPRWDMVKAGATFGASPATIEPVGSTGAALYWTGWYTYPDGKFIHRGSGRRYWWFERVGTWQYLVNGQCAAVLFIRLRVTARPPKIEHGHTKPAKATALATLNYGEYNPLVAIRIPVRLRGLH